MAIAHLKDGNTKLAFTATEYALAQKNGIFNFFYSGEDAQYIAGMTHANLPNAIVLEKHWFGYTAYPPTRNKAKWGNDRIVRGGGWGMRILRPGGKNTKEEIIPEIEDPDPDDPKVGEPKMLNRGDYRVDTDVISSFEVGTNNRITPDNPAIVTIFVDGNEMSSTETVLPRGGSQLVWVKWHTVLSNVN